MHQNGRAKEHIKTSCGELFTFDYSDLPDLNLHQLYARLQTHMAVESGIIYLQIDDDEYSDTYTITLQPTNLGLSAMCALNGRASYQADKSDVSSYTMREVINVIAGAATYENWI